MNSEKSNINKLDKLDVPRNIVLKMPKVEIVGKNEIKIENHKGIIIFDTNEIKINTKLGVLRIEGANFNLLFMGGQTLVIEGSFKSLEYEGDI